MFKSEKNICEFPWPTRMLEVIKNDLDEAMWLFTEQHRQITIMFQIDLQEMGVGPDIVVDGGDVEMGGVGDEKVVVIGGGIVVKIGISQLDWPEMKSEFEFKFGQFSNNKQILSVSW